MLEFEAKTIEGDLVLSSQMTKSTAKQGIEKIISPIKRSPFKNYSELGPQDVRQTPEKNNY